MSAEKIPVIKFMFKEEFKVLKDALNIQPAFDVEEFPSANDLATYLSTVPAGLVIVSLKDKNDLIQVATFMKIVKKVAKDTAVKVVVFNFSGEKNFEKAVAKLGIQDLVEPAINTKALKFKLDFWMKALNVQLRNNSEKSAQKVKTVDPAGTNQEKKSDPLQPNWGAALELEDDIWILKNDNDCKRVLSKWLIRFLGPSPYIAQWTELKPGHWRFDIKESEKEMFCAGAGSWFFAGDQKPDFVWKENIWMITGDNFSLYYKDGDKVFQRVSLRDRSLSIAKNSDFAKTKEQVIIDSFDKELVFKKEAENFEDLEGKNKTDHLKNGPLSGKNKSDEIDGGPLSGKSKTTNEIKGGPLSGKNKGEAPSTGNLSGKIESSSDSINSEGQVQKTKTGKESTFWNNKNEYKNDTEGADLGVKLDDLFEGAELSRERSDNKHQKYYKNHNEADQYGTPEEKERKKREAEEEKESGPLSGKSSTDQLEGHYDNNGSKKEHNSKEERSSDLTGKSKTDRLKSHMGQKDSGDDLGENKEKSKADKANRVQNDSNKKQIAEDLKTDMAARAKAEKPLSSERDSNKKETGHLADKTNSIKRDKGQSASAESERKNKKDREDPSTRKNNKEEVEAKSSRTRIESPWEGAHDYSLNEARKDQPGAVLPFPRKEEIEEEKQRPTKEKELDALTNDAKVISFITHNNKKVSANLDDYFDETIIFSTDAIDIKPDGKVALDLLFKSGKETQIKLEGNVVTVDEDGEGSSFVTVQINKESVATLGDFMKLFEMRQQNVNEFMKRAKGL